MGDWTTGLQQHGLYWVEWVTDIDSVLSNHSKATVACYGTRHSSKASGSITTIGKNENIPGGDIVSYREQQISYIAYM